jgi:hypothetical protein
MVTDPSVPMVSITQDEYDELLHDQAFADALRGAGVDNWEGYDDAMAMMEELEG